MNYKAITTLKKADTEGRIPAYTLDQYVRSELCHQLAEAIKQRLLITRSDANQPTVDFSTELILLSSDQWRLIKETLHYSAESVPSDLQLAIQQLINEVDTSCS
ncbi:hypothetical protein [Spirosoma validum]|uniref:Uncharacterized protein n=1 Tax=Spirosoma validum TaxID=2771355 RepID=A0A927B6X0_9BACT|nr:hypothetical protein [Spirosoma validum]MBD2756494.1 hypothetical protein [Spirosoma validum]